MAKPAQRHRQHLQRGGGPGALSREAGSCLWELMQVRLLEFQDTSWGGAAGSRPETEGRAQTWGFLPRNAIFQRQVPAHSGHPRAAEEGRMRAPPHPHRHPVGNVLSSSTSLWPQAEGSCGS